MGKEAKGIQNKEKHMVTTHGSYYTLPCNYLCSSFIQELAKLRISFFLRSYHTWIFKIAMSYMSFILYSFYTMCYSDIYTAFSLLPKGENFHLSGSPTAAPWVARDARQKVICRPLGFTQAVSLKKGRTFSNSLNYSTCNKIKLPLEILL